MSSKPPRPAPTPDALTQFYWDAAREHRLEVQRCAACERFVHWPQVRCPFCGSDRLAPSPVSGRGTVFTFTIVEHVFHPGFDVPYSLALVELEEQAGLRLLANIVDCPPEALRIGLPVEVTFEERDGSYVLPQFRPRSEAPS